MAPADRLLLAVITIVAALVMLPGMDAIAKLLSGHLPILQIVWARYVFYALFLLPPALQRYGLALFRPARPCLQLLRGALMAFSALMFFSAIARMPLADAMAVFFVYPLLILIASTLFMGEAIGWLRWTMVIVGFIGAALVTQPSVHGLSAGAPYALASGTAYATAMLATRKLASHDSPLMTAALSALVGALIFSLPAPIIWQSPAPSDWVLLALMGTIAAMGHFLIVRAHQTATASQLAPYGYTEIVASIFFGLVIFGDIPRPLVWVGIVIIIIIMSGIGATWSNGRSRLSD